MKKVSVSFKRIIVLLLSLIMMCGMFSACANQRLPSSDEPGEELNEPEPLNIEVGISDPDNLLEDEWARLLKDYAYSYRKTLLTLQPENIRDMYFDPDGESAYMNATAFDLLRRVRKKRDIDLTLEWAKTEYLINDISENDDGGIRISLQEFNTQKFKHLNEPSYSANLRHFFIISEKDGQWYIANHMQGEDFYLLVMRAWRSDDEELSPAIKADKILDLLLADADENIAENPLRQNNDYIPAGDFTYDREKAVNYARHYWNERNYELVTMAYDMYGGNCQNFCSQAMYAGGLSMDYSGPVNSQWKWYGEAINEAATPYGRSYSWRGVDEFYTYATSGNTNGVICVADRPFTMADKGDILQFGAYGEWRHSVIITDIIYDENGKLLDFAIASNTADRYNYPASAYIYTAKRVIHILGNS